MNRNKLTLLIIPVLIIFGVISASAFEIPLRIVVNGEKVAFPDAQPFVDENSRTQVPARFVSEALGATVAWNGETKTVTVKRGEKTVEVSIDKNEMYINGELKWQDTAPRLKDDRTFVPLRFVSEALGAEVEWKGEIRTAYIKLHANHANSENKITNFFTYEHEENGFTEKVFSIVSKKENSSYQHQIEQIRSYLNEKITNDTTNEIINYANSKITVSDFLEYKEFVCNNYTISVCSDKRMPITLSISFEK